jgi:NAD(P)-dependent dehydrogenase (short-subunit alcohol dehydrogenase family)
VNQPIEFASEDDVALQLGVNLLGPIRLMQAFLPSLRNARGRIVNVTSGVTKISQPFVGLYAASKAALDQISLTLRIELEPFGVAVIIVDPGLMRTRMTEDPEGSSERSMATWSAEAVHRYGDANRASSARVAASVPGAKPPEAVAETVARALGEEKPRDRYLAGSDARAADLLDRLLPWRMKQRLVARLVFGS